MVSNLCVTLRLQNVCFKSLLGGDVRAINVVFFNTADEFLSVVVRNYLNNVTGER